MFIMCGKSCVCDVHCGGTGGGVNYIYVILVSLVGITS